MSIQSINMTKMLLLYRYISLVVTSLFYIVGVGQHTINQRLIVITGMVITSLVMNYLYVQNKGDKRKIVLLIVIETIGNCIILTPSGGLQSPYIWYILNTIIIAGLELGHLYLWINVGVYLVNMIGVSYMLSVGEPLEVNIRLNYLNLVAGFLLVAFIIELLISYAKALEEKSKQSKQYLDYTMKLYETVYLFTSQGNKESLINVILDHIGGTLNVPSILFIEFQEKKEQVETYAHGLSEKSIDHLVKQVDAKDYCKTYETEDIEILRYEKGFIGIPIRHTYSTFGILIVSNTINIEELRFIAYVSGMIFKKIELETVNQELLLSEEQNRIANEIHDSVLQKLFGVSCSLFTTAKKIETIESDKLRIELNDMRNHITQAMTELRATIYGMSWNKSGKNDFVEKLEHYIETMEALHRMNIDLRIEGNIELLKIEEQKALYRVCCEAIANGIRHGRASQIHIVLVVGLQGINMMIQDNGKGFNYDKVTREGKLGLGIKNMEQLVQSLNGILRIESVASQGTNLHMHIQHDIAALQKNEYKEGII